MLLAMVQPALHVLAHALPYLSMQALSPPKKYRHPDGSLQDSPPAPDPVTMVHSAVAQAQTQLPMVRADASERGVCCLQAARAEVSELVEYCRSLQV